MRRVSGLLVGAALLFGSGCSAEPATPAASPLYGVLFINEFMASNQRTISDEAGQFPDWVELYNSGDSSLELRTTFMTDDLSRPMKWTFPDTVLPPQGHLLVWCDGGYRQGALHASFKLAVEGEQLGLYVTDGDRVYMVDTLSFGPQSTDTSYGRLPDGGEWQSMAVPTPGEKNSSGVSALHGRLFVNEFMANNRATVKDEAGDYDDRIELFNAHTLPVSILDLYLTDDLRSEKKWALPDTVIPAGGFLLVWADNETGEGPLHASFNLGAATGEQVGLFESSGTHVLVVDTLTFGAQKPDTSYGRIPDGGDVWQFLSSPSPRAPNRLQAIRVPKSTEGQQ